MQNYDISCKGTLRQVFICLRPRTPYPEIPEIHFVSNWGKSFSQTFLFNVRTIGIIDIQNRSTALGQAVFIARYFFYESSTAFATIIPFEEERPKLRFSDNFRSYFTGECLQYSNYIPLPCTVLSVIIIFLSVSTHYKVNLPNNLLYKHNPFFLAFPPLPNEESNSLHSQSQEDPSFIY
jgi:hypothetical protein